MIVRLSNEAERDIEAIGDYIAQDDPARALAFVQSLRVRCLGLAETCRGALHWCHAMPPKASGDACMVSISSSIVSIPTPSS